MVWNSESGWSSLDCLRTRQWQPSRVKHQEMTESSRVRVGFRRSDQESRVSSNAFYALAFNLRDLYCGVFTNLPLPT